MVNLIAERKEGSITIKDTLGEDYPIDDAIDLTKGVGNCDGILVINNADNLFLPNDITDRQGLCDLLTRLSDLIDKVNTAIPTMLSDPSVITDITILKQDIINLKNELK